VAESEATGSKAVVQWSGLLAVALILTIAHAVAFVPSEPFFNNDETRHVMTGVYVRDALLDPPSPTDLNDYTKRYYQQYPALGLIVWPPAFYGFEGIAFLLFGDSFPVGRLLVLAFALMACVYCFLLVRRTHDQYIALAAALIVGLSPLVFEFSARVMLEVPALAWCLMAAFHFHRYLDNSRKLDLAFCCLATALAALTRFDGIVLAPLFFFWLLAARKMSVLKRRSVLIGIFSAILAVAPFYYLTWRYVGGAHLHAVKSGTTPESAGFLAPSNFIFYPLGIPRQIGWAALLPLVVGFVGAFRGEQRKASWPYLALMLAVYVTFTPLAEVEDRHAIYWVPALAVFVAIGCRSLAHALTGNWRLGACCKTVPGTLKSKVPGTVFRQALNAAVVSLVLVGIGVQSWLVPRYHVYGYEDAARYVVEHNDATPVCLFDGFLNGDFIYQLRRLDPQRRLWVLRGDKLLYTMLSDPHGGYEDHAKTETDVLRLIHRYDPEWIVIEEPQVHFDVPGARLLRKTLRENPERFSLEKVIPIRSDHPFFKDHELHVYRNKVRNPNRANVLELKDLGFGRNLGD
jgi:hypothetical protein